jgi:hypothetical protein
MSTKNASAPMTRDLHVNAKLAIEIRRYLQTRDPELVKVGKQKGLLILDNETKEYKLSNKGHDFMSKWEPKSPV